MEPNRPEGEPGPPTESVTQQATAAAKTAAKTAAKKVAKKAAKEAAKQAATAAAANPYVAATIVVVVLLIGGLVLVGAVLMVGFLGGAVGDLYEEAATRPHCYDMPEGGEFEVSAHQPHLGRYQGVVGVVDGYETCVDPRLIYILSDIADEGFHITESFGFGITSHHFWVRAFQGGDNRYSSVCPSSEAETGCWESPHKQGRGIDIRAINGEVPNPAVPYTEDSYTDPYSIEGTYIDTDDTDGIYDTDDIVEGVDPDEIANEDAAAPRLSKIQEMVVWLTCDYAKTAEFGFVLVWSRQWTDDAEAAEEAAAHLPEGETAPEWFDPCDPPDGRFAFVSDPPGRTDHAKHVHLDVRCGPRWHRPAWNPVGPYEGRNWQRDYVVMRCGDDVVRQELAKIAQILEAENPT